MAWLDQRSFITWLACSDLHVLGYCEETLPYDLQSLLFEKQETLILGHSSRKKPYFSGHRLCFTKPVYPQSPHIPRLREESPFPLGVGSMRGKSELGMRDSKLSGTWEEGIDDLG